MHWKNVCNEKTNICNHFFQNCNRDFLVNVVQYTKKEGDDFVKYHNNRPVSYTHLTLPTT